MVNERGRIAGTMLARMRSSEMLRHGALVMSAVMGANIFGFLYHVVVSRELGVTRYGVLYALISISVIALLPASILSPVITKFSAELYATGGSAHVRALARFVVRWFLWLALAYALAGALLAAPLAAFFHVPSWAIVLNAVATGLFAISAALRAIVQGCQDFVGYAAATIADGSARLIAGAVLVVLGWGIGGGLGGLLVAGVCGSIAALLRLPRRGEQDVPLHVDWRRVAITTYGAAVATACVTLLGYGDVAIVKHYFNATDAGIYSAASLDGKMMLFLVGFAPALLLPKVVDRLRRGERTRGTLFAVLGVVFVLSTVGLACFALFPRFIVDVLNSGKFSAAIPYLFGYAGAMVLLSLTNLLTTYAIGIHRMAFALPLMVVCVAGLGAIAAYHPSIGSVIGLLIATNAVALLTVAVIVAAGGPTATARVEAATASPVG